jgi:hypothetical protein
MAQSRSGTFRLFLSRPGLGEHRSKMPTWSVGSKKREKRSLPERCDATEGAVRGVGLPAGSENREILFLLDVKTELRASRQTRRPHSSTPERGDKLDELTGLAGTTGFAGVLDGEAGRGNGLRPRNLASPPAKRLKCIEMTGFQGFPATQLDVPKYIEMTE